jgi:DNA invertase Pin-like site-specific DNA recombinase
MTAILGYARVDTMGQDLDTQLIALSGAGADAGRVFTDKLSGSAGADRLDLGAKLDYAREGEIGERRILLRALREEVNTPTPSRRAVAAIIATLADLELELGRERRVASREARRTRKLSVKPAKLSAKRQGQLRQLVATGELVRELAAAFGIGWATVHRYLRGTAAR